MAAPPPPPAWTPPQQSAFIPQSPPIIIVPPGGIDPFDNPGMQVATNVGFRLMLTLIPVGISLLVGGIIAFTSWSATSSTTGSGLGAGLGGIGGWNGKTPILCGGNDEMTMTGVRAVFGSGTAVTVGGNCHFTCKSCDLEAPQVISAGGNAQVDLIDCVVKGTQAVVAGGNSEVRIVGASHVFGTVTSDANAEVTVPPGSQTASPADAPVPVPTVAPVAPHPPSTSGPSHAVPSHAPSSHH